MRIGIDGRPLQLEAYRHRGIGIHLRSWIQAAQNLDTEHTFAVLYDAKLPRPSLALSSPRWQLQPLSLTFSPLSFPSLDLHRDPEAEFVFDSALEAFLIENQFDLFHATYTLIWEVLAPRRLYHTRWVVTFYDLIPLIFPKEYLDPLGERGRHSFAQRLGAGVYAQRIQTISQASKTDLVRYHLPADKIDVIYGGVDPSFAPLEPAQVQASLAVLHIREPYIFSVSGFHHTKNLRRLCKAYALLPASLRAAFRLIVRCPLSPADAATVQQWLTELGIQERVSLLAHVTQAQLVSLYNGAALVVHPTLYEGLGLPVVEALQCGAPVVTSRTSSLPEVGGEAAEYVDPMDSNSIAQGMARVLTDADLRAQCREVGFAHARRFTWQKTAQAVLDSYTEALKTPLYSLARSFPAVTPRAGRRLRLAFWSPFNPRPSGVSDYSELLVAELGKEADVDLFVDGYPLSNSPLFDTFPSYDGKAYPQLAARQPYDMTLYQVGNNPLHRYMYDAILRYPGIITLHDIHIYHLVFPVFASVGRLDDFWQEVAFCEGAETARKAKLDYLANQLDHYRLPLNKRLVVNSRGVVVHSAWGQQRVVQYSSAPPVRVIPFGLFHLPDDNGQFGKIIRKFLGLPTEGFIFGVFGNLHRVKRLPVTLRAFARVRARHPRAALFLMGPADPSVAEVIAPLQQNPAQTAAQGIHLYISYAGYDLMLMAMQAVDVGLNLRYPTAGETSGTLSMLLGQGKPTIVSGVGSFTEYPDACCPKIPVNEDEEELLYQAMLAYLEDSQAYQQAVQSVYAYTQDKTWSACAASYLSFIEEILRV